MLANHLNNANIVQYTGGEEDVESEVESEHPDSSDYSSSVGDDGRCFATMYCLAILLK